MRISASVVVRLVGGPIRRIVVALCAALLAVTPAAADNAEAMIGLFGAIMGNVVAQQARDSWTKLPRAEMACVQRGLARQGMSIQGLAQNGIDANDPRLADVRATCARFSAPLRQNVECPIVTSDGDFVSRCDEGWTVSANGSGAPVSADEAVQASFSGGEATIGLFERADAKSRRLQMVAAAIEGGNVPSPNFDCARAKSATEIAICRSYRLSALDGEYGSLYARTRPLDRKGLVKKQAVKFYQDGTACRGAEPCVERNLVAGVNFMAAFLRKNGQTVVTSLEHEKEEAAAAAARAEAKRQQAEAQQKQEEAAAAAARQKQQELEAARAAATALVAEASEFLASDRTNPNVLPIAKGLASLNAAMKAADADAIRSAASALSLLVHGDLRYSDFVAAKAAKLAEDNARYLADATTRLARQKAFIVAYIAENPLADASAQFIGEVDGIDAALKSPDLAQLRTLSDRLDGLIAQRGLTDRYTASLNQPAEAPAVQVERAPPAPVQAAGIRSDKNAFLIDGPAADIVLMYNASQAPHVHKNLRGDFVFDGGMAAVCFFQKDVDPPLLEAIRSALSGYNLASLTLAKEACSSDDVAEVDVVAVRRGDFLNDDPAYALPLLKAIETDAVRPMKTISGGALADAVGAAEKTRKQIEADIANGAIEGYGLIVLTASPGSAICAVVPDRRGGHLAVLAAMKERLDTTLGVDLAGPVLEPSGEAAFADVQRKACIGVYASVADLKDLLPALRREQIAYRLDENWVTPAQVDGMQAAADKRDAEDEEAATERRQKAEEKQALDAQRAADLSATKAARQAALRQQYGSLAAAQATALAGSVRAFAESPRDDDLAALFPAFTDWYRHQMADHWELLTLGGETADYGQAEWKGRQLEGVIARVSLRLRNMQLGRYEDACFDFGELIDAEFDGMRRDPVVSACDDPETVASWKTGHRFVSQWLAE